VSGADPYIDPASGVLRNRFGLTDLGALEALERQFVTQRMAEGTPRGSFDLSHLQAIHRHLFQDVYEWAGKLRTVEIAKGGHQFQFTRFIETGLADVHRRLERSRFLKDLSAAEFARGAGQILGDVNYVHPFREGNGRVQLCYLEHLATESGHRLDLLRLERRTWMEASRQAHEGESGPMSEAIRAALET
jgi:cell filamentation protein